MESSSDPLCHPVWPGKGGVHGREPTRPSASQLTGCPCMHVYNVTPFDESMKRKHSHKPRWYSVEGGSKKWWLLPSIPFNAPCFSCRAARRRLLGGFASASMRHSWLSPLYCVFCPLLSLFLRQRDVGGFVQRDKKSCSVFHVGVVLRYVGKVFCSGLLVTSATRSSDLSLGAGSYRR